LNELMVTVIDETCIHPEDMDEDFH